MPSGPVFAALPGWLHPVAVTPSGAGVAYGWAWWAFPAAVAVAAAVALASAARFRAGHKRSFVPMVVAPMVGVVFAPQILTERVEVTDAHFACRFGNWTNPGRVEVRYADLASVVARCEEQVDHKGRRWTVWHLDCAFKDGRSVRLPFDLNGFFDEAVPDILARARAAGVLVIEPDGYLRPGPGQAVGGRGDAGRVAGERRPASGPVFAALPGWADPVAVTPSGAGVAYGWAWWVVAAAVVPAVVLTLAAATAAIGTGSRRWLAVMVAVPVAGAVFIPRLFTDRVEVSDAHFACRHGSWADPVRVEVRFADVGVMAVRSEESVDRTGRRTAARYLDCFLNNNDHRRVPFGAGRFFDAAAPDILARARAAGVRVVEPPR